MRSWIWLRIAAALQVLGTVGHTVATASTKPMHGPPEQAVNFSKRLMEKNIFVSAIRPPTVPQDTSRLRISLMATHTINDLALVVDSMAVIGKEMGILQDKGDEK